MNTHGLPTYTTAVPPLGYHQDYLSGDSEPPPPQMLFQQLNGSSSCHYQSTSSVHPNHNNYPNDFNPAAIYGDNRSQLPGIQESDQFTQQQYNNVVDSTQFAADRLSMGEAIHGQPQNAVTAVAAASLLLAANCYDGVLVQSQQHPQSNLVQNQQVPNIGLENMPTDGYPLGFYAHGGDPNCETKKQSNHANGLGHFPSTVNSADSCQQNSLNFQPQQALPLSAVGNLLEENSNCPLNNNNNLPSFNCLQSHQSQTQIVQDPQQALTHQQAQVSPEKVTSACAQQCASCNEMIRERWMLCVNQSYYHSMCLRCSVCATKLEDFPICYWKGGSVYCKPCYGKFQSKCALCDRHIQPTDWVRRAHSYVYHLACFSCNHCKRQLSTGEQFSLQDHKLLCKQHYLELFQGEDAQQKNKTKRIRTTFAEEQLNILQAHFQMDCNPDGADLERIANQTGLSKRVTQVWFQNSRARQKKYQVGGKKVSSTMSGDRQSDTGPLGSSNSGRSSPTTTIDSSISPVVRSPSSVDRHALMLTSDLSAAHAMDSSVLDYVTDVNP